TALALARIATIRPPASLHRHTDPGARPPRPAGSRCAPRNPDRASQARRRSASPRPGRQNAQTEIAAAGSKDPTRPARVPAPDLRKRQTHRPRRSLARCLGASYGTNAEPRTSALRADNSVRFVAPRCSIRCRTHIFIDAVDEP